MPWITLTADDVATRLADAELDAVRNAAVVNGDPLPEVVAHVVREIRGRVLAYRSNRVGPAGTIPDELENAALALIRGRLITRLPIESLMTEDRRKEITSAEQLLRDVAAGNFVVSLPDEPAPTTDIPAPPAPSWSGRRRKFTRRQQDGA